MSCPPRKAVCLPDLIQGETGQWQITITDQDDVAVNITDAAIEFRLTARGIVAASLNVGSGVQVTDGPAGQCIATLPAGTTLTLSPWLYEVHLITTDIGGRTHITPASLRLLPKPTSTT